MPKCIGFHKATVVITGRAHCFHDNIYYAHLASVRFEHSLCRRSLMATYILYHIYIYLYYIYYIKYIILYMIYIICIMCIYIIYMYICIYIYIHTNVKEIYMEQVEKGSYC